MEDNYTGNDPFEQESQLKMQAELTEVSSGFLLETAKWAKFLSILGFIGTGFMVLGAFFIGSVFSSLPGAASAAMPFGGGVMTVVYLLMAAFYFFPTLYLYRFATKTKSAILGYNTEMLTEGLENLKSVFKFWGIFSIVMLSLYALGLLFAMFGAFAAM